MSLFDTLNGIADTIKQQRHLINSEAETVHVSVYPFIQALGYKPFNLNDVKPQFTADPRPSGGERVDYAIMLEGKPIILIEAKSANISLTENHWRQLHDYFNAEEVRIGVLTNGLQYRFYSDLKKRNIMDSEPFLVLDMLQLDKRLITEIEGFRKSRFRLDSVLLTAQKLTISRFIHRELNQPSDKLVEYFAQSISSRTLDETQIQQFAPIVKEVLREFKGNLSSIDKQVAIKSDLVSTEMEAPKLERDAKQVEASKQVKAQSNSSKKQSVEIPVFGTYFDERVEATLLFSPLSKAGNSYRQSLTKIRWKGDVVSVNEAEFRAIKSINPEIVQPQWNGWDSWKLHDPNTREERAIRELLKDPGLRGHFV